MPRSAAEAELARLYEAVVPAIHRRALSLLRDEQEAWDVVQEVFRKLVEDPRAYRGDAAPLHYCYRIATHLCLNRLRALRVRKQAEATQRLDEAHEPASVEARNLVVGLLDRLDARDLEIATLHFFDQLTQEEIAEVVGHTRKTVGLALQRVRAVARELAEEPKEKA